VDPVKSVPTPGVSLPDLRGPHRNGTDDGANKGEASLGRDLPLAEPWAGAIRPASGPTAASSPAGNDGPGAPDDERRAGVRTLGPPDPAHR
jgi:hypothetical protein